MYVFFPHDRKEERDIFVLVILVKYIINIGTINRDLFLNHVEGLLCVFWRDG